MTRRQIIITIFAALLTVVFSFGLSNLFKGAKDAPQKPFTPQLVRKVKSELIKYSDVSTQVTSTGRIVSQQAVDLIAEVQGKLLQGDLPLKKGINFSKGDLLVKIFSKDAFFALQSRKSAFLNLLANMLPDMKIDYPESYQKWVHFFEETDIEKDLPELPQINSSQEKIFLSARKILSEYYALKSDEVRLRKYSVYAPYDGAIQEVMLETGSVVNPGSRIAKIIKIKQLELETPVETASAGWIKIGDKALLKTEQGEVAGYGYVKRKSSFVDISTQSISIFLSVFPLHHNLFPGQYLKAEFSGMIIKNAMEIPRNAVFNRNIVFISDNGFLSKRPVNVLKINESTIIFNGLDEGMVLVTQPLANASENMRVQTDFTQTPPHLKADSENSENSEKAAGTLPD